LLLEELQRFVGEHASRDGDIAELKARIAKTVKFVEGFKPKDIDGPRPATSRSASVGKRCVSKVSLISCTLRCRTSIST
jgi:hypothetical protein